jgi:hypothetical protein
MQVNGSRQPPNSFHAVLFNRSLQDVVEFVSGYLTAGLAKGQPAVVVASGEHRESILRRLSAGFDVAALGREGLLMTWDVAQMVNQLLVNGRIDHTRLERMMSPTLRDISQNGARSIRIYGEGAGALWERNLWMAAVQLEVFTNRLTTDQPVMSVCGYDATGFRLDTRGAAHVCGFHTHVLSGGWDEATLGTPGDRRSSP